MALFNRSKFSLFLSFGYSCEKAPSKKINRKEKTKVKSKVNSSDHCKKWTFHKITWMSNQLKELDQQAEKVTKQEEAIPLIEYCEKINRSNKKGIINITFRQGRIFKRCKDSERFEDMLQELVVSPAMVYFKLNLLKLLKKYSKLKKSTLTLNFLKKFRQ